MHKAPEDHHDDPDDQQVAPRPIQRVLPPVRPAPIRCSSEEVSSGVASCGVESNVSLILHLLGAILPFDVLQLTFSFGCGGATRGSDRCGVVPGGQVGPAAPRSRAPAADRTAGRRGAGRRGGGRRRGRGRPGRRRSSRGGAPPVRSGPRGGAPSATARAAAAAVAIPAAASRATRRCVETHRQLVRGAGWPVLGVCTGLGVMGPGADASRSLWRLRIAARPPRDQRRQ